MYYPGVDFWDGVTRDQIALMMEAVYEKERRDLVRAIAVMHGLDDPADALPRWTLDHETTEIKRKTVEPFDFSLSAQRGIVEAVERGLIKGDVWADQVLPAWENLLAATGDLAEWRAREIKSLSRRRARQYG